MNIFQQIDRKTKSKEVGGQPIEIKPSFRDKLKQKLSDKVAKIKADYKEERAFKKEVKAEEKKAFRTGYKKEKLRLARKKGRSSAKTGYTFGSRLTSQAKSGGDYSGAGSGLRDLVTGNNSNKKRKNQDFGFI